LIQRRLLTSMFGIAIAAILVFAAGVELVAVSHPSDSHPLRLSPLQVGLVGLIALAVAAGLAMAQARRLARPVQDLARAAGRIGSGDSRPVGRRYGVAELDSIAEGLDSSAQRVTDLISAEQDFAVDASHQLRTPLTALSMRLEEMVAAASNPEVVKEEGTAAGRSPVTTT
jgi:signal transduction histidine kinase